MKKENAINVISPYLWNNIWVFDDEKVGLDKEPFVAGMPQIIETFCKIKQIKEPEKGFNIIFSGEKFPTADIVLVKKEAESGGTWYEIEGMKGWLCPALFKYFDIAPDKIYVELKSK